MKDSFDLVIIGAGSGGLTTASEAKKHGARIAIVTKGLPGGAAAGSHLHLARAICRRAERKSVALSAQDAVPKDVIVYLNRLSDWLFTTARWSNLRSNRAETKWAGLRK